MIIAPPATVSAWRNESARLLAVSRTSGLDRPVVEALYHASALLLASAFNATPGGPGPLVEGVKMLVKAVEAEQAAGGDPGTVCPAPQEDGLPFTCGCGPAGRRTCADAAFDAGHGELYLPMTPTAGDNGCEGGARRD